MTVDRHGSLTESNLCGTSFWGTMDALVGFRRDATRSFAISHQPACLALPPSILCSLLCPLPIPTHTTTSAAAASVLDPALLAYDAYGLHHAADKPEREGHAISMMGAKDAAAAICELHRKFEVGGWVGGSVGGWAAP